MQTLSQKQTTAPGKACQSPVTTQYAALSDLGSIEDAWSDLAAHALEPNFFYTPRCALSAARHIEPDVDLKAVLVWQQRDASSRQLIGLFPFSLSRLRWGVPVRLLMGWITNYFASSAPLLRAGHEDAAVLAFLEWLDIGDVRPDACMLTELALDGATFDALKRALAATGRHYALTRSWERALLQSELSGDAYIKERYSRSTRQGMQRKRRRLADQGELTFHVYKTRPQLEDALEAFMELEVQGWKGSGKTALACNENSAAFAREVFTQTDPAARVRIDMLRLDGRPIAVSVSVVSGNSAWYLKPTYDETLGRFSPGMIAQMENLKHVLDERAIGHFDSACIPGHVIESVWRERKRIGDVLFTARKARGKHYLARLVTAETYRHKLREQAKKWRDCAYQLVGR